MSDAGRSRSRSGSVSSGSTITSTDSAVLVAMNKVYITSEKAMRVVGVNSCTSMHLFGSNFVVGAHAAPGRISDIAKQAAEKAGRGVTSTVVWAPDTSDGNTDGIDALRMLERHCPQARNTLHYYAVDNKSEKSWWEFEARPGNPGVVVDTFVPGDEEEGNEGDEDEAEEGNEEEEEEEEGGGGGVLTSTSD